MSQFQRITIPTANGIVSIDRCFIASSMVERLVGLLKHTTLPDNEGLLLEACNQVHTFFMRFPIDIVVLNKQNEIVGLKSLHPWRMSRIYFKGHKILELALGRNQALGLRVGQKLEFAPCSN